MTLAILSRTDEKWVKCTSLTELFQQNRSLSIFKVPFISLSSSRGSGGVSLTSGSLGPTHANRLARRTRASISAVSFFMGFTSLHCDNFTI